MRIDCVFSDGQLSSAEPDEYVQITNHGRASQELLGWELHHEAFGTRSFTFPGYLLLAGETIRVYTNGEAVPVSEEWGDFSFGRGSAIWSNTTPATAVLLDAAGGTVSEKTYDVKSPPGCSD